MTAAERWRSQLEAWALPDELLDAVEASPYGWSKELWRRRSQQAADQVGPTRTVEIVREISSRGPVLDVGAGRGRASIPLARDGRRVVMVEPDAGMLDGLAEELEGVDLDVEVVAGRWPDVADRIEPVDVSMCAHVVYDVPDIAPFIRALDHVATEGAVVELTPSHPWAELTPYYEALHGLSRPAGPTADDLADVVRETLAGTAPQMQVWSRPGGMWFESMEELVDHFGRRLLVTSDRRAELERLLAGDVTEEQGRLRLGSEERFLVTLWWRTGAAG